MRERLWRSMAGAMELTEVGGLGAAPWIPKERGSAGEFIRALYVAGDKPVRSAPWPTTMDFTRARGQGTRRHKNAWDLIEKKAGKEESSPA